MQDIESANKDDEDSYGSEKESSSEDEANKNKQLKLSQL